MVGDFGEDMMVVDSDWVSFEIHFLGRYLFVSWCFFSNWSIDWRFLFNFFSSVRSLVLYIWRMKFQNWFSLLLLRCFNFYLRIKLNWLLGELGHLKTNCRLRFFNLHRFLHIVLHNRRHIFALFRLRFLHNTNSLFFLLPSFRSNW